MDITIAKLTSLGQYTIDVIDNLKNKIKINPDIINNLKKEVTVTKRYIGKIPQDDPELNQIVSYFTNQNEIVDEVAAKPDMKRDIEYTVRFITSNQLRINEILLNP